MNRNQSLAIVYFMSLFLIFTQTVSAATFTWDGGGVTNNWSEAANWSTNTVPTTTDSVIFDGTSIKNMAIDTSVVVINFNINIGYSGTITFENLGSLICENFSHRQGTFTGGAENLDINSQLLVSNTAIFNASPLLFVGGNLVIDRAAGAIFNQNPGSSLILDGSNTTVSIDGNSGAALVLQSLVVVLANDTSMVMFDSVGGLDSFVLLGNLTLGNGKLANSTILGNGVFVAAEFDGGAANITVTGGSIRNVGGIIPTGVWTIDAGIGGIVSLQSDLILGASQTLNINSGIFQQRSFTTSYNLTAGHIIVGINGKWFNRGDGDITLGVGVTNFGSIDIDGGGSSVNCNETDTVLIRSTTQGVQRTWLGSGSFFISDADIQDQAGTSPITVYSSTDSNNNGSNWTFNLDCFPVTWDGGGVTEDWGEAENWVRDVAPDANAVVVFDGISTKNSNISSVINPFHTIGGIRVNSGYTGTITYNSTFGLRVGSSGIIQSSGILHLTSSVVNGDLTVNDSVFEGGSTNISGNASISNATIKGVSVGGSTITVLGNLSSSNSSIFSSIRLNGNLNVVSIASGGLVVKFEGNTSSTVDVPNNTVFGELRIAKQDSAIVTFAPNANIIVNNLNLDVGTLNGANIECQCALRVGGSFNGGTSSLKIENALSFNGEIFSGAKLLDSVTLNSPDYTLLVTRGAVGQTTFNNFNLQAGHVRYTTTINKTVVFNGNYLQTGGDFFLGQANQNAVFNGNFTLQNGVLDGLASNIEINGNANLTGGTFTSSSNSLFIGDNFTRTSGNIFNHNNGTVIFDDAVNSSISLPDSPNTTIFNNVKFDTPNVKTINSSNALFTPFIANGSLEFNNGSVISSPSPSIIEARGNVTVGSGLDSGQSATIKFSGSSVQTFTHSGGIESFNWTVDKPAGTVNLTNNLDISDTSTPQLLNLQNGTITTGINKVSVGAEDTISRANGFIIGNIERTFDATGSRVFDVGTTNGYAPATINATAGTFPAKFTVGGNNGVLAGASNTTSVTRNWSLTPSPGGITSANIRFNYLQTDVPTTANESNFTFLRRTGGSISNEGISAIDTTNNFAVLNGVSQFSDWSLGTLAPTSASVFIRGRVLTNSGRGISKAMLILTDTNGDSHYAMTNPFGYYRFQDLEVGRSYVLSVSSKRFTFANPSRVITLDEDLTGEDFIADEK
jgi:hypothetical protein